MNIDQKTRWSILNILSGVDIYNKAAWIMQNMINSVKACGGFFKNLTLLKWFRMW